VIRRGHTTQATPITLTAEERQGLEALAVSRKSEARMWERARIVLLAAAGMGSRAIGREVGCEPATASKWRVRYAREREWPASARPARVARRQNTGRRLISASGDAR
jgi:hypothetical protein